MKFRLTDKEGEFLVKLARRAVNEYLKNKTLVEAPDDASSNLLQPRGVFVTINSVRHGRKELRGCIGYPYPTLPLVRAVIESAVNSATADPRFPPLSKSELDLVVFEVSVLTPPELIKIERPTEYPSKIKIGRDGLITERGPYKGLLLPQVPVEWNWDEEEFLCQCCIKAGLPPDCWLLKDTKIYKFQCQVFAEVEPDGHVEQKM